MLVDHITCASCQERIREFEPDIVLSRLDGSAKRFYHTRCEEEARRYVAGNGPEKWSLTHRRLFWDIEDLQGGAA